MEKAYKTLGLKQNASKEDVERAYKKSMQKYNDEAMRNYEQKQTLIDAYNTINHNSEPYMYLFQPFRSLMSTNFGNFEVPSFPSISDRLVFDDDDSTNTYYYARESMSTVRDGKVYKKVRENNNGKLREFEEHKSLEYNK